MRAAHHAARLHQPARERKRKAIKEPWLLHYELGWVGLPGASLPAALKQSRNYSASKYGGWLDEEQFWLAYNCHAQQGGSQKKVGKYMSAEQAKRKLDEWKKNAGPPVGVDIPFPVEPSPEEAKKKLHFHLCGYEQLQTYHIYLR